MICDFKPNIFEKYRVRLTVGGDVLDYFSDSSSPAASLLETKLLINSVISDSDKGAKFCTLDIKDYFLQSILEEPEYIRIHKKYFQPDICEKYNIESLVHTDDYVYCKLQRGMYGLKQAARLARDKLLKILAPFGYSPTKHAPNIWTHHTRQTKFCLCVDDLGIKYYNEDDIQHLMMALRSACEITFDRSVSKFCDIQLDWNYTQGYVDVSMPEYVMEALEQLNHPHPTKTQYTQHPWVNKKYGKTAHLTSPDTTSQLSPDKIRHIQRIVGTFLYYARAVDTTNPSCSQ